VKTNAKGGARLMHNSVKNNDCDITYVLKEPRRRSKCVIHKAWRFPLSSVDVITELCISAVYRISSSGSSLTSAMRTLFTKDVEVVIKIFSHFSLVWTVLHKLLPLLKIFELCGANSKICNACSEQIMGYHQVCTAITISILRLKKIILGNK
jgi:hypothetical protein